LPDGNFHSSLRHRFEGTQLLIDVTPAVLGEFTNSTPVEIDCGHSIYLGEVSGNRDSSLIIQIAHYISKAALASIHGIWSEPALP